MQISIYRCKVFNESEFFIIEFSPKPRPDQNGSPAERITGYHLFGETIASGMAAASLA